MDSKKLSIKSFIKGTNSSRLQSLRLPRDLSLGGTKVQPKKIYKPNVNAVRNKNRTEKIKNTEKAKAINVKDKSEHLKERFIQSSGVFSEGIGTNQNPITKTEKKINLKENKTSKKIKLSDILKQSINQTYPQIEDVVTNNLKTDLSDSDSEEKFPFAPSNWDKLQRLVEIKSESKNFLDKLPPEYQETNITNPILTMWQLPDSFAFKEKKTCDTRLSNLPEGQIGKILVHKSGKFEVSIADTKYILDSTLNAFSEDVACLDPDTKSCFLLGELKSRFVLSPDWGFLL